MNEQRPMPYTGSEPKGSLEAEYDKSMKIIQDLRKVEADSDLPQREAMLTVAHRIAARRNPPAFDGESVLTKIAREDDPNGGMAAPPMGEFLQAMRGSGGVYPFGTSIKNSEGEDADKECGPCRESGYKALSSLVDQKRSELAGLESLLMIAKKSCESKGLINGPLDDLLYKIARGERLV